MPLYRHYCEDCDETVIEFRSLEDFRVMPTCPGCGQLMPQQFNAAVRGEYKEPIQMDSMGFLAHPDDVAEHRRRFPGVELRMVDGSAVPVMHSLNEKRKYLKDNGWVDRHSFTS
jgi:putative FmdB family regulatory protein